MPSEAQGWQKVTETIGGRQIQLRLLATTDLHGHLLAHDHAADRPTPGLGLVGIADQVAEARRTAANSLLFDNGDFLLGDPLSDLMVRHPLPHAHPVVEAMNALGYDAAALGNHEFNFGLPALARALTGARFPVLAANLSARKGRRPFWQRHLILERWMTDIEGNPHMIRVGVLGFLPPQVLVWDKAHLLGRVESFGIVETARRLVPRLRAAGADLLIALCHSGIGTAGGDLQQQDSARELAGVDGVDVLVAGHSHQVFPGPDFAGMAGVDPVGGRLHGKPAVMPGRYGSHLGQIDLKLTEDRASGRWRVLRGRSRVTPQSHHHGRGRAAAQIRALVAAAVEQTTEKLRQPVGRTQEPLSSHFALLPGNAALRLVGQAQGWHVRQALRATRWADLPVLSANAPFKHGGRGGADHYTVIPAGNIALRHVADLYPYPNTIRALLVTGGQIQRWLEHSSSVFRVIRPGVADQPLLTPDIPFSSFDVIEGLSYAVDPAKQPGMGRIGDLRHAGRPVQLKDQFVLATNSYRADGGGGFAMAVEAPLVLGGEVLISDILRDYIAAIGVVPPLTGEPGWRFAPLPGTSVTYDAPVGARATATEIGLEEVGEVGAGILRFRLRL